VKVRLVSCVEFFFMGDDLAAAIKRYVLMPRCSTSSPLESEALSAADLAEARELDGKHKCVVHNSYFRAWQHSLPERLHRCPCMKITVWCLATDGSVLQTLTQFAGVSENLPGKPKAPMTLFVDETLLKPGMDTEEVKRIRLDGVKLWKALSPDEKILWKKKATDSGTTIAQPQPKEHIAFKLVIDLGGEQRQQSVISMLRNLDSAQPSACNSREGREPVVLATLRGVLRSGSLAMPFRGVEECLCEYWDAINADLGTNIAEYERNMVCSHLGQHIFHVQFSHQLMMASTMLRLQERYECPNNELRGRCFSLAEYKAWERKRDPVHGFRYYAHWPGFNVPGSVVKAALQEAELMPREQALKQALGDVLSLPNFYVIGTTSDDASSSLYHEVCHAMYELNAAYRADVDAELANIAEGPMCRMKAFLRCEQYADVERILQDEVHAYLSEGDTLGCKSSEVSLHTKTLQAIFLKHAGTLGHLLTDMLATGCLSSEDDSSSEAD